MRTALEIYFHFADHATTWRTELLAGLTTFIAMAYIIFVNPAILHETGMPRRNWMLYLLAALFLLRFVYMAHA